MEPQVLAFGKGSTSILGRLSQGDTQAKLLDLRVGRRDSTPAEPAAVTGRNKSSGGDATTTWNCLMTEITTLLDTDCVVVIGGLGRSFQVDRFESLLGSIRDQNRLLMTVLGRYPGGGRTDAGRSLIARRRLSPLSDFCLEIDSGFLHKLTGFSMPSEDIETSLNRAVSDVAVGLVHRINSALDLTEELEQLVSMSITQKRKFLVDCCPWLDQY